MIGAPWMEAARRRAPALFAGIDANPADAGWRYLHSQVLALHVQAHLHPLEAFQRLEVNDRAVVDPRQSTMGRFAAGPADLKQVTLFGRSQGQLWVGAHAKVHNLLINAEAGPADIVLGPNTEITNCVMQFLSPRTSVVIGSGTTIAGGANMLIQEPGNYVVVGDDTMWSNDVAVRTSDSHAVYDAQTGERLNGGRPVVVHRHVWVGRHTSMNMGTEVGVDAVIGQHCVTGTSMRGAVSYLGNPAMPGRRRISWDRSMAETLRDAAIIHPSRTRQTNHVAFCARLDALADEPTAGLSDLQAISRVLAADFPSDSALRLGPLCAEAQSLRVWAKAEAMLGVNTPFDRA